VQIWMCSIFSSEMFRAKGPKRWWESC
jgi:hypothetical protein